VHSSGQQYIKNIILYKNKAESGENSRKACTRPAWGNI